MVEAGFVPTACLHDPGIPAELRCCGKFSQQLASSPGRQWLFSARGSSDLPAALSDSTVASARGGSSYRPLGGMTGFAGGRGISSTGHTLPPPKKKLWGSARFSSTILSR